MKKEIKVFDKQKSKDLRKSIKDYVNLSIRYEKTKLQNLEKTLQDMQQPVIRSTPFLYQQQMLQHQSISPSASLSTNNNLFEDDSSATSSSHPEARQKKRRQKQHLHQNYKELQKPLQSSASLPTRNRKKAGDHHQHDSDSSESGTSHNRTTIARDDTNTNRISMSASYDDRLSATNWLSDTASKHDSYSY